MKLYGETKSAEQIIAFVEDHVSSLKKSRHDRYHNILSFIEKVNPGEKRALDYGCGWGHFSVAMEEKGYSVEGIDYSENEIEICETVWKGKSKVNFSRKKIDDFPEGSFDLILSNQVLEHVHNPGNYLSQINRVMKDGGTFIIALPNIMNPRFFSYLFRNNLEDRLIQESLRISSSYDKAHDHINAWDPFHLVRLVTTVGFQLEKYMPMEGMPTPFKKFPYVHFKKKPLANYSYTMLFKFRKVKSMSIPLES